MLMQLLFIINFIINLIHDFTFVGRNSLVEKYCQIDNRVTNSEEIQTDHRVTIIWL